MTITLSAEQEQLIAQALQAGGYESANDVIARALEVLRAEDGLLHEQKDEIEVKIDRALSQFNRDEFFTAEQARADMERRKAAWLRDHSG
jgi:Arc/MetJ-type ribon-helix-helix transcriptional regulator